MVLVVVVVVVAVAVVKRRFNAKKLFRENSSSVGATTTNPTTTNPTNLNYTHLRRTRLDMLLLAHGGICCWRLAEAALSTASNRHTLLLFCQTRWLLLYTRAG